MVNPQLTTSSRWMFNDYRPTVILEKYHINTVSRVHPKLMRDHEVECHDGNWKRDAHHTGCEDIV